MWNFKELLMYLLQKDRKKNIREEKKGKDQPFAADSYVSAFRFLCSFGHYGLLLSLLTSPKDLIHSHHQPLHKILKSIIDGFTKE